MVNDRPQTTLVLEMDCTQAVHQSVRAVGMNDILDMIELGLIAFILGGVVWMFFRAFHKDTWAR